MSWREHWEPVKSAVVSGDVISGCRDNDTRTYRLFVNKGWVDVDIFHHPAHTIEDCECCDLSIDNLRALVAVLQKAVDEHTEWPDND